MTDEKPFLIIIFLKLKRDMFYHISLQFQS